MSYRDRMNSRHLDLIFERSMAREVARLTEAARARGEEPDTETIQDRAYDLAFDRTYTVDLKGLV